MLTEDVYNLIPEFIREDGHVSLVKYLDYGWWCALFNEHGEELVKSKFKETPNDAIKSALEMINIDSEIIDTRLIR